MAYDSSRDPLLQEFLQAWYVSTEFVSDHFEKMWQQYRMWRGHRPKALSATWSKIMLNTGHSLVEDRIPTIADNWLGSSRPYEVKAKSPRDELDVRVVEDWLHWKLFDESEINLRASAAVTIRTAVALGTAYRVPFWQPAADGSQMLIGTRAVDPFSIFPAPTGGLVNPQDRYTGDAVDWFFHVDWWPAKKIEAFAKSPNGNMEAWEACKKMAPQDGGSTGVENYADRYRAESKMGQSTGGDWRQAMQNITAGKQGESGRETSHPYAKRKVHLWHTRDRFRIIVQHNFVVYDGPALLGDGVLPLVKYSIVNDMNQWYGIGTTEMVHDLIMALMFNLSFRFDWMAHTLHPPLFIRDDVIAGRAPSTFRNRPGAVIPFSANVTDINSALYYNQAPASSQQHFIEEDSLKAFLQSISGFPDIARGVAGGGADSATMGMALMRQAQGRLGIESMQMEQAGVEEARLLLRMAGRFLSGPQRIRNDSNPSGFPFQDVDAELLDDRYTILCNGTAQRQERDSQFQRMLAMYPLWNASPLVNQEWLTKRSIELSDLATDVGEAVMAPQPTQMEALMAGGAPSSPMLGGAASPQDIGQRQQAVGAQRAQQPGGVNPRPSNVVAQQ